MKNPFKQKRCQQCGWELGIFSKDRFCSDECIKIYVANQTPIYNLDTHREKRNTKTITLTNEELDLVLSVTHIIADALMKEESPELKNEISKLESIQSKIAATYE